MTLIFISLWLLAMLAGGTWISFTAVKFSRALADERKRWDKMRRDRHFFAQYNLKVQQIHHKAKRGLL